MNILTCFVFKKPQVTFLFLKKVKMCKKKSHKNRRSNFKKAKMFLENIYLFVYVLQLINQFVCESLKMNGKCYRHHLL